MKDKLEKLETRIQELEYAETITVNKKMLVESVKELIELQFARQDEVTALDICPYCECSEFHGEGCPVGGAVQILQEMLSLGDYT